MEAGEGCQNQTGESCSRLLFSDARSIHLLWQPPSSSSSSSLLATASRSFVSYHLPSSSPSSSLSNFDPPDPFTTLGEVIYVVFLHAKSTLRYCSTFNIVPENASTYLPLFLLCGPSLEQRRTEQKPFFSFRNPASSLRNHCPIHQKYFDFNSRLLVSHP